MNTKGDIKAHAYAKIILLKIIKLKPNVFTLFHLVLRLRMGGVTLSLPLIASLFAQGHLCSACVCTLGRGLHGVISYDI
jgi:hypothetical protein